MKYDLTKKLTIGASRTLYSLQQAMFSLLCEKSFEEIAVGELCEKAMLPRATFYNYFDDKYDQRSDGELHRLFGWEHGGGPGHPEE